MTDTEYKTYPCGCKATPVEVPNYCPEHGPTPDVALSHPSRKGDTSEKTVAILCIKAAARFTLKRIGWTDEAIDIAMFERVK